MIVKEILDYTIKFQKKIYLDFEEQLLIYIRGKGGVEKSKVVKAIKMGFILVSIRKELVISAPTGFTANSIDRSIGYIALGVNNQVRKNYQAKINVQWLYCSSLIIDKVSMIDLKLLTLISKQL